jgi:AraC family transcriptional regulator, ethanolamine operon transcriptional activator
MNIEHTHFIDQAKLVSLVASTIAWEQLQPGRLDVAYQVAQVAPLTISSRTINLAFHGHAQVAPERAGIMAIESSFEARWRGSRFDAAAVATGKEIDVRTTGASTLLAVAVDRGELQQRFPSSLDAADLADKLARNRVTSNRVAAARLRSAISKVLSRQGAVPATVGGTLIPLLAGTLDEIDGHSVERSQCLSRRYAAVRTCETYMREHIDETVTLLDLSQACGMRSRSLINAFTAITGLSPMDYLKRLRLSAVRSTLLRADFRSTRVIDVATEWGFWHMGHFAHDYRAMFGEAPSQTLRGR